MPVYFIRAGDDGPVKIGVAQDPDRRLREMQIGSPVLLTIIRVTEGHHDTEKWLHRHFAAQRQRGEWFTYCDEMLSVDPHASCCDEGAAAHPVGTRPGTRLRDARKEAGFRSAAAFAKAIGVPDQTYRAHESGQNDLSGDHAATYARHLGVCPAWLLFGDSYPREGPSEAGPTPIGVVWATPEFIENERKSHG